MSHDVQHQLTTIARELDRSSPPLTASEFTGADGAGHLALAVPAHRRGWAWPATIAVATIVATIGGLAYLRDAPGASTLSNAADAPAVAPALQQGSPEPPANKPQPADAVAGHTPGERYFPPECLVDTFEEARGKGLVARKISGAGDPVEVTSYSVGDTARADEPTPPWIGEDGAVIDRSQLPEWIAIGSGDPPVIVGYTFTPAEELAVAPEEVNPACHPDLAIYDAEGVLIGSFIDSLPEVAR